MTFGSMIDAPDVYRLEWDEISKLASGCFQVWVDQPELAWARSMWSILSEAGLTMYEDEIDRVGVCLKLLDLASSYRVFCALAFGEGARGDWRDDVVDPAVALLPFSLVTLGRVVQSTSSTRNIDFEEELWDDNEEANVSGALRWLIRVRQPKTMSELRLHVGDSELLQSLMNSTSEAKTAELDDENSGVDDGDGGSLYDPFDTSGGDEGAAYEWIRAGLPL